MLQGSKVADVSSAVWMANYEALDRTLHDQVIVDAVASRVGQVHELLLAYYVCDIYIHHSSSSCVADYKLPGHVASSAAYLRTVWMSAGTL